MEEFMTALSTAITSTALWGALEPVVPVISIAVLFSLGVYFLRRVVKGVSHGKARI